MRAPFAIPFIVAFVAAVCGLAGVPASAQNGAYRLESGDIVEIWTAQEPSLNRQIIVRPDGRVSLPLAGHLEARGLTLEELEASILERLATFYRTSLDLVAILHPPEAADPPTLYIAGAVTTPGAFRHRPGMTILHAVSVAGGILRPPVADDAAGLLEMQRSVRVARRQLATIVAQEARLLAETAGRRTIEVAPADLDRLQKSGLGLALEEALAQERRLMDLRAQGSAEDVAAAERALALAREEIMLFEAEREASEAQLVALDEESAAMEQLVARGLAPETRAREMRIRRGELLRANHQLEAGLARARGAEERAQAELVAVRRRAALDRSGELHDLQRRREELEINLSAGERTLAELGLSGTAETEPTVRYTILRLVDGVMRELPAQALTEVLAGDLVNVVRLDPDRPEAARAIDGIAPAAVDLARAKRLAVEDAR